MKAIVATLTLVCISLILVGIFPLKVSTAVEPNTIVGMWLFDEGSGEVAKDSSGKGNDGTLAVSPKWVAGKFGKALEFNGTTDSMQAETNGFPIEADDRTIAFWVKSPNMAVGNRFLAGWGTGSDQQMSSLVMGLNNAPSGKLAFWGWVNDFEAPTVLKNDTWYHITFTLEGNTSAKLYLDGKVDKEGSIGPGLNTLPKTKFGIANFTTVMTAFTGTFDEVIVFNFALSEKDIQGLMQGVVRAVSPLGKLVATWGQIKN